MRRLTVAAGSFTRPVQNGYSESLPELDAGSADHEALTIFVLDPDVYFDPLLGRLEVRDEAVERESMVRLYRLPIGRSQARQPCSAGSNPVRHQPRQHPEAHVTGRDHPGKSLSASALVVHEARRFHPAGPGVVAHLLLAELELLGTERVAHIDRVETGDRHWLPTAGS